MLTRREFTTLALSSLAWPQAPGADGKFQARRHGLGAQTYSFRQLDQARGRRHVRCRSSRRSPSAGCATASCGRRCSSRPKCRAKSFAAGASRRPSITSRPSEEVRQREDRHSRLQLQLQRQFHRTRNRSRLRDRAGARRRVHHRLEHAVGGETRRAVRREAQDDGGDAQPFESQGSE